jgi:hypothetical protein
LYGSYEALEGGVVHDALVNLTGRRNWHVS